MAESYNKKAPGYSSRGDHAATSGGGVCNIDNTKETKKIGDFSAQDATGSTSGTPPILLKKEATVKPLSTMEQGLTLP